MEKMEYNSPEIDYIVLLGDDIITGSPNDFNDGDVDFEDWD